MYAHVNVWRLKPGGASSDDAIAHEVAANLRVRPGFRAYTLVRTGEREVVAVTVFDSDAQLREATEQAAAVVQRLVLPLAEGEPERRRGEVLFHECLADAA
jgi:heme-degrading monooxygenase HmoA